MRKITFEELKNLNGKSIEFIHPIEEEFEPEKGIMRINKVNVFNCYKNRVKCETESFAHIFFYDKRDNMVANISVFNVNDECLVIESEDTIYSETTLRVMFDSFKK